MVSKLIVINYQYNRIEFQVTEKNVYMYIKKAASYVTDPFLGKET